MSIIGKSIIVKSLVRYAGGSPLEEGDLNGFCCDRHTDVHMLKSARSSECSGGSEYLVRSLALYHDVYRPNIFQISAVTLCNHCVPKNVSWGLSPDGRATKVRRASYYLEWLLGGLRPHTGR